MSSEPEDGGRPFASYTSTDHARVKLGADLFTLAGLAHQALIPERAAGEGTPDAGIEVARQIVSKAQDVMEAAVIAAHESGLTWEQIGRALGGRGAGAEGITRQSAWTKYAPAVSQFHEQLADALDRARRGEKPVDYSRGPWPKRVCNTDSYAPLLDQTATVDYPAVLGTPAGPGQFTAALSDPATAFSAQISGARGPDTNPVSCRYTEALDDPYEAGDGMYGWLSCTLREGHPGRHQLSVATEG
jgi:hypothetical protein